MSQEVFSATSAASPSTPFGALERRLGIAGRLGDVTEAYSPRSSDDQLPDLLIIQDLHANLEVQEHIAAILKTGFRRWDLREVFVEGAARDVDPSVLKAVPARQKKALYERLLRENLLTGPELAAAQVRGWWDGSRRLAPLHLRPLEDESLYWQHLQAYRDAVTAQPAAANELRRIAGLQRGFTRADVKNQLALTQRLVGLRLTPDDYAAYLQGRVKTPQAPALAPAVAAAERFYRLAKQRDAAMVKNLQHGAVSGPRVIVVGGFHAAGIAERWRAMRRSYAVVTPRVNQLGSEFGYRRRMLDILSLAAFAWMSRPVGQGRAYSARIVRTYVAPAIRQAATAAFRVKVPSERLAWRMGGAAVLALAFVSGPLIAEALAPWMLTFLRTAGRHPALTLGLLVGFGTLHEAAHARVQAWLAPMTPALRERLSLNPVKHLWIFNPEGPATLMRPVPYDPRHAHVRSFLAGSAINLGTALLLFVIAPGADPAVHPLWRLAIDLNLVLGVGALLADDAWRAVALVWSRWKGRPATPFMPLRFVSLAMTPRPVVRELPDDLVKSLQDYGDARARLVRSVRDRDLHEFNAARDAALRQAYEAVEQAKAAGWTLHDAVSRLTTQGKLGPTRIDRMPEVDAPTAVEIGYMADRESFAPDSPEIQMVKSQADVLVKSFPAAQRANVSRFRDQLEVLPMNGMSIWGSTFWADLITHAREHPQDALAQASLEANFFSLLGSLAEGDFPDHIITDAARPAILIRRRPDLRATGTIVLHEMVHGVSRLKFLENPHHSELITEAATIIDIAASRGTSAQDFATMGKPGADRLFTAAPAWAAAHPMPDQAGAENWYGELVMEVGRVLLDHWADFGLDSLPEAEQALLDHNFVERQAGLFLGGVLWHNAGGQAQASEDHPLPPLTALIGFADQIFSHLTRNMTDQLIRNPEREARVKRQIENWLSGKFPGHAPQVRPWRKSFDVDTPSWRFVPAANGRVEDAYLEYPPSALWHPDEALSYFRGLVQAMIAMNHAGVPPPAPERLSNAVFVGLWNAVETIRAEQALVADLPGHAQTWQRSNLLSYPNPDSQGAKDRLGRLPLSFQFIEAMLFEAREGRSDPRVTSEDVAKALQASRTVRTELFGAHAPAALEQTAREELKSLQGLVYPSADQVARAVSRRVLETVETSLWPMLEPLYARDFESARQDILARQAAAGSLGEKIEQWLRDAAQQAGQPQPDGDIDSKALQDALNALLEQLTPEQRKALDEDVSRQMQQSGSRSMQQTSMPSGASSAGPAGQSSSGRAASQEKAEAGRQAGRLSNQIRQVRGNIGQLRKDLQDVSGPAQSIETQAKDIARTKREGQAPANDKMAGARLRQSAEDLERGLNALRQDVKDVQSGLRTTRQQAQEVPSDPAQQQADAGVQQGETLREARDRLDKTAADLAQAARALAGQLDERNGKADHTADLSAKTQSASDKGREVQSQTDEVGRTAAQIQQSLDQLERTLSTIERELGDEASKNATISPEPSPAGGDQNTPLEEPGEPELPDSLNQALSQLEEHQNERERTAEDRQKKQKLVDETALAALTGFTDPKQKVWWDTFIKPVRPVIATLAGDFANDVEAVLLTRLLTGRPHGDVVVDDDVYRILTDGRPFGQTLLPGKVRVGLSMLLDASGSMGEFNDKKSKFYQSLLVFAAVGMAFIEAQKRLPKNRQVELRFEIMAYALDANIELHPFETEPTEKSLYDAVQKAIAIADEDRGDTQDAPTFERASENLLKLRVGAKGFGLGLLNVTDGGNEGEALRRIQNVYQQKGADDIQFLVVGTGEDANKVPRVYGARGRSNVRAIFVPDVSKLQRHLLQHAREIFRRMMQTAQMHDRMSLPILAAVAIAAAVQGGLPGLLVLGGGAAASIWLARRLRHARGGWRYAYWAALAAVGAAMLALSGDGAGVAMATMIGPLGGVAGKRYEYIDRKGRRELVLYDRSGSQRRIPVRTDTSKFTAEHDGVRYAVMRHSIRMEHVATKTVVEGKWEGAKGWVWLQMTAGGDATGIQTLPSWARLDANAQHVRLLDAESRAVLTAKRQGEFWSWERGDIADLAVDEFLGDNVPKVVPVLEDGQVVPDVVDLELPGGTRRVTLDDELIDALVEMVTITTRSQLENTNMALVGHKSTGKNLAVYLLAGLVKQPVRTISLHQTFSEADLRYRTVVGLNKPGTTEKLNAEYYECGRLGYWLVVDEANKVEEEAVLTTVNTVNQERREGNIVFDPQARFMFLWNPAGGLYTGRTLDRVPDFKRRLDGVFFKYPGKGTTTNRLVNGIFAGVKDKSRRDKYRTLTKALVDVMSAINDYADTDEGRSALIPPMDQRQLQRTLITLREYPQLIPYVREILALDYPLESLPETSRAAFETKLAKYFNDAGLNEKDFGKRFLTIDDKGEVTDHVKPGRPVVDEKAGVVIFGNKTIGEVRLPLGSMPVSEKYKDFPDTPENNLQLWLLAMDLKLGFHLAVLGETSTGKSTMINHLFEGLLRQPIQRTVQATGKMSGQAVLGHHETEDFHSVFPESDLAKAMDGAIPYYRPEITKAPAEVLAAYNNALEYGFFTMTSQKVASKKQAKPGQLGFVAVFDGNTGAGYHVNAFSAEFASRVRIHVMTSPSKDSLVKILRQKEQVMRAANLERDDEWTDLDEDDFGDLAQVFLNLREAKEDAALRDPPSISLFERVLEDLGRYPATALELEDSLPRKLLNTERAYESVIQKQARPLAHIRIRRAVRLYAAGQQLPAKTAEAVAQALLTLFDGKAGSTISNEQIAALLKVLVHQRLKLRDDAAVTKVFKETLKGFDSVSLQNAVTQTQVLSALPEIEEEKQSLRDFLVLHAGGGPWIGTLEQALQATLHDRLGVGSATADVAAMVSRLMDMTIGQLPGGLDFANAVARRAASAADQALASLAKGPAQSAPVVSRGGETDWTAKPELRTVQIDMGSGAQDLTDNLPLAVLDRYVFWRIAGALEVHPSGDRAMLRVEGRTPGAARIEESVVLDFVRDPKSGRLSAPVKLPLTGIRATPIFSPDGTQIIVGYRDESLFLFDYNRSTRELSGVRDALSGPGADRLSRLAVTPTWDPSGDALYFHDPGPDSRIVKVSRATPGAPFTTPVDTAWTSQSMVPVKNAAGDVRNVKAYLLEAPRRLPGGGWLTKIIESGSDRFLGVWDASRGAVVASWEFHELGIEDSIMASGVFAGSLALSPKALSDRQSVPRTTPVQELVWPAVQTSRVAVAAPVALGALTAVESREVISTSGQISDGIEQEGLEHESWKKPISIYSPVLHGSLVLDHPGASADIYWAGDSEAPGILTAPEPRKWIREAIVAAVEETGQRPERLRITDFSLSADGSSMLVKVIGEVPGEKSVVLVSRGNDLVWRAPATNGDGSAAVIFTQSHLPDTMGDFIGAAQLMDGGQRVLVTGSIAAGDGAALLLYDVGTAAPPSRVAVDGNDLPGLPGYEVHIGTDGQMPPLVVNDGEGILVRVKGGGRYRLALIRRDASGAWTRATILGTLSDRGLIARTGAPLAWKDIRRITHAAGGLWTVQTPSGVQTVQWSADEKVPNTNAVRTPSPAVASPAGLTLAPEDLPFAVLEAVQTSAGPLAAGKKMSSVRTQTALNKRWLHPVAVGTPDPFTLLVVDKNQVWEMALDATGTWGTPLLCHDLMKALRDAIGSGGQDWSIEGLKVAPDGSGITALVRTAGGAQAKAVLLKLSGTPYSSSGTIEPQELFWAGSYLPDSGLRVGGAVPQVRNKNGTLYLVARRPSDSKFGLWKATLHPDGRLSDEEQLVMDGAVLHGHPDWKLAIGNGIWQEPYVAPDESYVLVRLAPVDSKRDEIAFAKIMPDANGEWTKSEIVWTIDDAEKPIKGQGALQAPGWNDRLVIDIDPRGAWWISGSPKGIVFKLGPAAQATSTPAGVVPASPLGFALDQGRLETLATTAGPVAEGQPMGLSLSWHTPAAMELPKGKGLLALSGSNFFLYGKINHEWGAPVRIPWITTAIEGHVGDRFEIEGFVLSADGRSMSVWVRPEQAFGADLYLVEADPATGMWDGSPGKVTGVLGHHQVIGKVEVYAGVGQIVDAGRRIFVADTEGGLVELSRDPLTNKVSRPRRIFKERQKVPGHPHLKFDLAAPISGFFADDSGTRLLAFARDKGDRLWAVELTKGANHQWGKAVVLGMLSGPIGNQESLYWEDIKDPIQVSPDGDWWLRRDFDSKDYWVLRRPAAAAVTPGTPVVTPAPVSTPVTMPAVTSLKEAWATVVDDLLAAAAQVSIVPAMVAQVRPQAPQKSAHPENRSPVWMRDGGVRVPVRSRMSIGGIVHFTLQGALHISPDGKRAIVGAVRTGMPAVLDFVRDPQTGELSGATWLDISALEGTLLTVDGFSPAGDLVLVRMEKDGQIFSDERHYHKDKRKIGTAKVRNALHKNLFGRTVGGFLKVTEGAETCTLTDDQKTQALWSRDMAEVRALLGADAWFAPVVPIVRADGRIVAMIQRGKDVSAALFRRDAASGAVSSIEAEIPLEEGTPLGISLLPNEAGFVTSVQTRDDIVYESHPMPGSGRVWMVVDGKRVPVEDGAPIPGMPGLRMEAVQSALTFSPNGTRAAIKVWAGGRSLFLDLVRDPVTGDLQDAKVIDTSSIPGVSPAGVDYSPDGRKVLVRMLDSTSSLTFTTFELAYDPLSRALTSTVATAIEGQLTYSPDGSWISYKASDMSVSRIEGPKQDLLWDVDTVAKMKVLGRANWSMLEFPRLLKNGNAFALVSSGGKEAVAVFSRDDKGAIADVEAIQVLPSGAMHFGLRLLPSEQEFAIVRKDSNEHMVVEVYPLPAAKVSGGRQDNRPAAASFPLLAKIDWENVSARAALRPGNIAIPGLPPGGLESLGPLRGSKAGVSVVESGDHLLALKGSTDRFEDASVLLTAGALLPGDPDFQLSTLRWYALTPSGRELLVFGKVFETGKGPAASQPLNYELLSYDFDPNTLSIVGTPRKLIDSLVAASKMDREMWMAEFSEGGASWGVFGDDLLFGFPDGADNLRFVQLTRDPTTKLITELTPFNQLPEMDAANDFEVSPDQDQVMILQAKLGILRLYHIKSKGKFESLGEVPLARSAILRKWKGATPTFSFDQDRLIFRVEDNEGQNMLWEVPVTGAAQKPSTLGRWQRWSPSVLRSHAGAESWFTAVIESLDWLRPLSLAAAVPFSIGLDGWAASLVTLAIGGVLAHVVLAGVFAPEHHGRLTPDGRRLGRRLGGVYGMAAAAIALSPLLAFGIVLAGWVMHARFDWPHLRARAESRRASEARLRQRAA